MSVKNEGMGSNQKLERPEDILRLDRNEIVVKLEKGEGTLKIEKVGVKQETINTENNEVEITLKTEVPVDIKEEKIEEPKCVPKVEEDNETKIKEESVISNLNESSLEITEKKQECEVSAEEVKENIVPLIADINIVDDKKDEPMDVDQNKHVNENVDDKNHKTEDNNGVVEFSKKSEQESITEEDTKTSEKLFLEDKCSESLDTTRIQNCPEQMLKDKSTAVNPTKVEDSVKSDKDGDKRSELIITNISESVKSDVDRTMVKEEVKSEVKSSLEIVKSTITSNAEAVDRFKAMFPELEVMHRLPEIDTTVISEKHSSREATVAQLLQQSYQNPIKWPKVSLHLHCVILLLLP